MLNSTKILSKIKDKNSNQDSFDNHQQSVSIAVKNYKFLDLTYHYLMEHPVTGKKKKDYIALYATYIKKYADVFTFNKVVSMNKSEQEIFNKEIVQTDKNKNNLYNKITLALSKFNVSILQEKDKFIYIKEELLQDLKEYFALGKQLRFYQALYYAADSHVLAKVSQSLRLVGNTVMQRIDEEAKQAALKEKIQEDYVKLSLKQLSVLLETFFKLNEGKMNVNANDAKISIDQFLQENIKTITGDLSKLLKPIAEDHIITIYATRKELLEQATKLLTPIQKQAWRRSTPNTATHRESYAFFSQGRNLQKQLAELNLPEAKNGNEEMGAHFDSTGNNLLEQEENSLMALLQKRKNTFEQVALNAEPAEYSESTHHRFPTFYEDLGELLKSAKSSLEQPTTHVNVLKPA